MIVLGTILFRIFGFLNQSDERNDIKDETPKKLTFFNIRQNKERNFLNLWQNIKTNSQFYLFKVLSLQRIFFTTTKMVILM